MPHDAAAEIVAAALSDPSYAGPFYAYNQMPMKTFMGQEPSVPVSVLVNALSEGHHGHHGHHGQKGHPGHHGPPQLPGQDSLAGAIKKLGLEAEGCAKVCLPEAFACMSKVPGDLNVAKFKDPAMQTCLAQARTCMMSCIAKDSSA